MSSTDSQRPNGSRFGLFLLAIVLLGLAAIVGYTWVNRQSATPVTAASNSVVKEMIPAPATVAQVAPAAVSSPPAPVPPGTVISAQEVLSKVDKWLAEHPTYHLKAVTAFPNGTIMGKMDVFAYSNAVDGSITAMNGQIFNPQPIDFVGVKKDGKFKAYFPATDQLVEQDLTQAMGRMPVLAGASGFKGLFKLSKNSYAEASEDLEVATLVLNTKDLKMGDLPSEDIYLSVRANNQGQLLGMEEHTGAGRVVTTFEYVTFESAVVAREAPAIPPGKLPQPNKSMEQVMQDEMRLVSKKPFGKKI